MRGIELKHIGVRSFMLKGLTARWGIDGNRPPIPPALRTALVAWYNTEIQRATNFDVVESYANDWSVGWANPLAGTFTSKRITLAAGTVVSGTITQRFNASNPEYTIKYTGKAALRYRSRDGQGHDVFTDIPGSGVYTLPGSMPDDGLTQFTAVGSTTLAQPLTIEQLPTSKLTDLSGNGHHLHLYGFTGSDNIVDGMLQHTGTQYGVSYGQPILTDYTVCSNRAWINPTNDNVFASKSYAAGNGAFIFEYIPNSTYSFGTETIAALTVPNGFSYQTKTSYNGIRALTVGTGLDTDHLVVGRIRLKDQPRSFHGAYKSFVLFNRTLTAEELAYVERWMA